MKSWKIILIVVVGIIALGIMGVFAVNAPQNNAISLEEKVTSAKSAITVQEKKRADLIPNLVDCVKAYDEHEYNTLVDVVAKRGTDTAASEIKTMVQAVAEQYPELASNENYKELMTELTTIENLISQYRIAYDKAVEKYNAYCRKFPASMFLSITGYEKIAVDKLNFEGYEDSPTNLFD